MDTTSFAVIGAYEGEEQQESEAALFAMTHEGDVPLFLHLLNGSSFDKVTLAAAVEALHEQLQVPESEPAPVK